MSLYFARSYSSISSKVLLLSEKYKKSLIACIVVFFNVFKFIKIPFLLLLYFSLLVIIILNISFNSSIVNVSIFFLISISENFII